LIKYQSWQVELAASATKEKKVYFSSDKENLKPSQWTIIIQYEYLFGNPAPLPPPVTLGVSVDIVGLLNGVSGILNEVSSSQSWVPIVGGTYRAFGREIQVGFGNDGPAINMLLSAIEDPPAIVDGESKLADSGVSVTVPQFATSFSVLLDATIRQSDSLGAVILVAPCIAGVFYPIHPMAYFLQDTTPQAQVYAFRKGYT